MQFGYASLLLVFLVAVVVHPLVPVGHWMERDDLVPWITALVAAVGLVRARGLGPGPVRPLVERPGPWLSRRAYAFQGAWLPVTLSLWFEAPQHWDDVGPWLLAAVATLVLAAAHALAMEHQQTAWDPPGPSDLRTEVTRGGVLLTSAGALGLAAWLIGSSGLRWLPVAVLVGLHFYGLGSIYEAPRTLRQRDQATELGLRVRVLGRFRHLVALLGPALAVLVLAAGQYAFGGGLGYADGLTIAVVVLAWAGVLWPPRYPVAVHCVLHEVVPAGGRDRVSNGKALPFDDTPRGALRMNPRALRRLRAIHPWVVPVQAPRLERLDDPVRPLWSPPARFSQHHVLGDARFEPHPETQRPQWEEITIRMSDITDVGRLTEGNLEQRRLVILRPFPERGLRALWAPVARTYRWQKPVAGELVQQVDATTATLKLRDGDVMVLSSEGVARAYELEIGAPVYAMDELGGQRPPQLEDYVVAR